jgi:DNA segregation ATPase FtsK/SpoIIIE-like protein
VIANRIIGAVDTLAHQGRALGYTVIVCTQYPTVEAIKFRSGLTVGLCLPIKSDQGVDMVLGEGARRKGAAADLLPRNLPGIAYMSYRGARLLRVARNGPDWSQIDVKPPDGGGKKPTPKRLSWKTTEDMGTDAKIYEMDHYREEPAA